MMEIKCSYTELRDPLTLVANPRNSNKHPKKQIEQLSRIMAANGFRSPIVLSKRSGFIVKGHGRLQAAILGGWKQVPVDIQEYENEAAEVADLEADNRIALLAEIDDELSKDNAIFLMDNNYDLDFGGFDFDFIKDLDKQEGEKKGKTDEDEIPEVKESVCKEGDLWELGEHRLLCGDSTDVKQVEKLMGGEKADLIHTDPPYNVAYSNQGRPNPGKKDLGTIKNDNMSDADFLSFLQKAFINALIFSGENSSLYIWYASKESINFHQAVKDSGWNLNQQIIWKKPMLLGRGKYQWAHEPCVFATRGSPVFTKDRTKTTVWDFGGYDKSKNVHPTQKPVFIPEEAINNSSDQGQVVLDLFLGSGSTLIACEKTNRKCYGMELDPHYCDVIIKRWEDFTGNKAKLISNING